MREEDHSVFLHCCPELSGLNWRKGKKLEMDKRLRFSFKLDLTFHQDVSKYLTVAGKLWDLPGILLVFYYYSDRERPIDLEMIASEKIICYGPDPKKRGSHHVMEWDAHREAPVVIRRQREGGKCGQSLYF